MMLRTTFSRRWRRGGIAIEFTQVPSAAALLSATALAAPGPRSQQPAVIPTASHQPCDTLVEDLRIGSLGGADEYTFSEINSIAVGESGAIYVGDTHPASIRLFSPDGGFVRRIGREGEGPGEFRSLAGISVLPDGRLAAWDRRNRRITAYQADGEHDEDIRADAIRPPYPFVDRAFVSDTAGNYYLRIFARPPSPGPDPRRATAIRYGYARVSPTGEVLDTIAAPAPPGGETVDHVVIRTHSGKRGPFPEATLDALSPFGHQVAGFNATYAFSILDPAGAIHVKRDAFQPVEVKPAERGEWRARVAFAARRSRMSFEDVPARKPAYRDLWVDADGRVWVHRYAEAFQRDGPIPELWLDGPEPRITWAEPSLHDIHGPDGRFLRCVVVPDDAEVAASRGRLVWGIARGALGEEYVVRWRIGSDSGPSRGPSGKGSMSPGTGPG